VTGWQRVHGRNASSPVEDCPAKADTMNEKKTSPNVRMTADAVTARDARAGCRKSAAL
jgi:hypothetical protein